MDKQNLKPVIEQIKDLFKGYTRDEANYIFEEAIIGLYQFQSKSAFEKGKYKITLRETGEEVN